MSERDEFLENGLGRFLRFLNNEEWINTKKLRENGSDKETVNDLDLFCSMVFAVARKKKMIRTVSMGKRRYRSTYVRYNGEMIHVYECSDDGYRGVTMMGNSVRDMKCEIAIEMEDVKDRDKMERDCGFDEVMDVLLQVIDKCEGEIEELMDKCENIAENKKRVENIVEKRKRVE